MTATLEDIKQFFSKEFPQANGHQVLSAGNMGSTVRHLISEDHLRPGGTVSGPTMFAIADLALYVAIFGELGITPLAVTTNLNINFLRKPAADKNVIGECKLFKVGKSLAMGEVTLFSEGDEQPIAHATGTYAIPPNTTQNSKK